MKKLLALLLAMVMVFKSLISFDRTEYTIRMHTAQKYFSLKKVVHPGEMYAIINVLCPRWRIFQRNNFRIKDFCYELCGG